MRWLLVAVTLSLLGPARAEPGSCPVVSADREYLQTLIAEQDRRNDLRFHAAETALGLATESNRQQFVAQQTYLNGLIEGAKNYVPRAENQETWGGLRRDLNALDTRTISSLKELSDKLGSLDLRITQNSSRGEGTFSAWSVAIALLGLVIGASSVVAVVVTHRSGAKPR